MRAQLPTAAYGEVPPQSSTVLADPHSPTSVGLWSTFQAEVEYWLESQRGTNDATMIASPVFLNSYSPIEDEGAGLQPFVRENLIKAAVNLDGFSFSIRSSRGVNGADLYVSLNGIVQYVVEVEGNWSLEEGLNFQQLWNSKSMHHVQMIQQVFTYATLKDCSYAVLTSYDCSYFIQIQRRRGNRATVLFSRSFSVTNQSEGPTILECFGYFQDLVQRTAHASSLGIKRNLKPAFIDPWQFDVGDSIGRGRCEVYDERTYGMALKLADKIKHHDNADEVKKESAFYTLLADLQGICILKLVWSGTYMGLFEGLALSPRGNVPALLTEGQKDELKRGLKLIHSKGVLHNDIKIENIIVDSKGRPTSLISGVRCCSLIPRTARSKRHSWIYASQVSNFGARCLNHNRPRILYSLSAYECSSVWI